MFAAVFSIAIGGKGLQPVIQGQGPERLIARPIVTSQLFKWFLHHMSGVDNSADQPAGANEKAEPPTKMPKLSDSQLVCEMCRKTPQDWGVLPSPLSS